MSIATRTAILAGTTAAAFAVAAPGAAFASTTPTTAQPRGLAAVKAAADKAIDLRLGVLAKDALDLGKAKHLTATDRNVLAGVVSHDVSGLTTLRRTIDADTTTAKARTDAATIYTGYRVFLLFQPQLRDVIAADALDAGAQQVTAAAKALTDRLSAHGRLTSAETAALQTATTDATATSAAVNGEVAAVVALVPADVSKGVRPAELAAAKADNLTARTQLAAARTALAAARALAKAPAATPAAPAANA